MLSVFKRQNCVYVHLIKTSWDLHLYHLRHSQLCRISSVCRRIVVTFLLRILWLLDLIELEKFR